MAPFSLSGILKIPTIILTHHAYRAQHQLLGGQTHLATSGFFNLLLIHGSNTSNGLIHENTTTVFTVDDAVVSTNVTVSLRWDFAKATTT
jgi:hypothetical protein